MGIPPLSFREYLELHPSEDIERSFELFLRFGSLPGVDVVNLFDWLLHS